MKATANPNEFLAEDARSLGGKDLSKLPVPPGEKTWNDEVKQSRGAWKPAFPSQAVGDAGAACNVFQQAFVLPNALACHAGSLHKPTTWIDVDEGHIVPI